LKEACRQLKCWQKDHDADPALTVSVNISVLQLMQAGLVAMVQQALQETGIEGRCLRLELTESVAMTEPDCMDPLLNELQELGVRLSIDDFGTGHSSLSHLHRFSVDTLKIDRGFVTSMELSEKSLNIVRTIVSLAHNMGMQAVAEGAETIAQVRLLKSMKCDSVQGFFYSQPLEPAGVEELFAERRVQIEI
jgi:EAL domain-containing protein (putative c-di-GMP-specific phosphodiesterase class I)